MATLSEAALVRQPKPTASDLRRPGQETFREYATETVDTSDYLE